MHPFTFLRTICRVVVFWFLSPLGSASASAATNDFAQHQVAILDAQGVVEISTDGGTRWILTQAGQGLDPSDRLKTGLNSRVALHWSDQSVVTFGALTELEILAPHDPQAESGLRLLKGILSFFHRDNAGRIRVMTRGAMAGVEGTEFVMTVEGAGPTERTTLSVIDGKVNFQNDQGNLTLTDGEEAVVEIGKAPVRTAGFIANNILQWVFYYPAVLDLEDLSIGATEQTEVAESLAAYRSGDLQLALAKYPVGRQAGSDAERIYAAALLLAVGQVGPAQNLLMAFRTADPSGRLPRLANALNQLIAAVKHQAHPGASALQKSGGEASSSRLPTELLAASYYAQSLGVVDESLRTALANARAAAAADPGFGFAWVRVAELEFSFGRRSEALKALNRGLDLTPRNAQGIALKGFLLAAENRTREAIELFGEAIATDPALGNGWLGRGLCRIRRGDLELGRNDLLVAAALEPQRAGLRSYLGKAYAQAGDSIRARQELDRAKDLDPQDPSAWLYSALLNAQENRVNEGIRDLEKSQQLNDHRRIYRSRLLLDQDRGVRSANLATLYRDAGMLDASVREAAKAVSSDYSSYSAHLFLANSYNELRDPNRITLRYETLAESEYLISNLLSPVGAGTLSPSISQQEYSTLFERNRFGVASRTEYLSRGAWAQSGAQYGSFETLSYAIEASYRSDPGQRINNDFEERIIVPKFKLKLGPDDTLYFQAINYEASGGDLLQYYDPTRAPFQGGPSPQFRSQETQDPSLILGYHHEWRPGVHTLILAGRLSDRIEVIDPDQSTFIVGRTGGALDSAIRTTMRQEYRGELELYSGELQQIIEVSSHTLVAGARVQSGIFHTWNIQSGGEYDFLFDSSVPPPSQDFETAFERVSAYGYDHWRLGEQVQLAGGIAFDHLDYPENFRAAPISDRTQTSDKVSPKAGIIWTPGNATTLRAAYTRSLAGASLDQSLRLEPSHISGFNQAFRSLLPESIAGANAGAAFETIHLAWEHQLPTGTYLGLVGQLLTSKVNRTIGTFESDGQNDQFVSTSSMREAIKYQEKSLRANIDQPLGAEWTVGAIYQLRKASVSDNYIDLPDSVALLGFPNRFQLETLLHQTELHAIYQHRRGVFAKIQALWNHQSNSGYSTDITGTDFWQLNIFAGYRFPRRQVEITLGLLNITDRDYRLNPLVPYEELPRHLTLYTRVEFHF